MSTMKRSIDGVVLAGMAAAVAIALAGGVVAAQSEAPTVSPSPLASPAVTAAPPLVTGTTTAFAFALPVEWQVTSGDALLQATGPLGATLALVNEVVPTEPTFDAYVGRVERDLEKAAGTDLPTTFRQAGSGVIARIETATHNGPPTALFLFPACADGARTLTVAGAPTAAETAGGPDSWDRLAASLDPCAVDPAPDLVLDPAAAALGPQYLALTDAWITHMTDAYKPLARSVPVKVWNKQMKKITAIDGGFIDSVAALPWTPELQPLADAWREAQQASLSAYRAMSKEKTVRGIDALQRSLERGLEPRKAASAALRLAMGIATAPQ